MAQVIEELMLFCGITDIPLTFGEFIPWFVRVSFSVGLLVFVISGIMFICQTMIRRSVR